MPQKLDIVLIAAIRPDILEITLNSFRRNMLGRFDARVIVNVDPVGTAGTQQDIANLCKNYFPNVIANTPERASFPRAVAWCWQRVETPFFLHLEDDWCLARRIDTEKLFAEFADENVVSVRFNRKGHPPPSQHNKFSMNPSVFRTAYIGKLLENFDPDKDPEAQFSRGEKSPSFADFPNPRFTAYGDAKVCVIDTGTWWRKVRGLHKIDADTAKLGDVNTDAWSWQRQKMSAVKVITRSIRWRLHMLRWRLLYCGRS